MDIIDKLVGRLAENRAAAILRQHPLMAADYGSIEVKVKTVEADHPLAETSRALSAARDELQSARFQLKVATGDLGFYDDGGAAYAAAVEWEARAAGAVAAAESAFEAALAASNKK